MERISKLFKLTLSELIDSGFIIRNILLLLTVPGYTYSSRAQTYLAPADVIRLVGQLSDTIPISSYDQLDIYHIVSSPALHIAGKNHLPTSNWGLFYKDKDGKCHYASNISKLPDASVKEIMLCWMGVADISQKDIEKKLFRSLSKTYGEIIDYNAVHRGIHAKWFSGTLQVLLSPSFNTGLWQSEHGYQFLFDDGICEISLADNSFGLDALSYFTETGMYDPAMNLGRRVMDLVPEAVYGNVISFHRMELILLANDITVLLGLTDKESDNSVSIQSLRVYVWMHKDGRCELTVLDNRHLTTKQSMAVSNLCNIVRMLPKYLFDFTFTLEGIIPGWILNATYEHGRWTFN